MNREEKESKEDKGSKEGKGSKEEEVNREEKESKGDMVSKEEKGSLGGRKLMKCPRISRKSSSQILTAAESLTSLI